MELLVFKSSSHSYKLSDNPTKSQAATHIFKSSDNPTKSIKFINQPALDRMMLGETSKNINKLIRHCAWIYVIELTIQSWRIS